MAMLQLVAKRRKNDSNSGQSKSQSAFRTQIGRLKRKHISNLLPTLDGYADRYTIYLPIFSDSGEVFTSKQIPIIHDLLKQCCGGFSQSRDDNGPPWQGEWQTPNNETSVDYHILIVVYAKYNAADQFFATLKAILEQEEVADQEIVIIEKLTVQFVKKAE